MKCIISSVYFNLISFYSYEAQNNLVVILVEKEKVRKISTLFYSLQLTKVRRNNQNQKQRREEAEEKEDRKTHTD